MKELNRELLQAVDHHDIALTRRLLGEGANIDTLGDNDMTPLGAAASDGDLPMVQLLLQKGAKAHVKDHSLVTPLMHAAYGGHPDIVRLFLKQNPDLVEKNEALLLSVHDQPAIVFMEAPSGDHPAEKRLSGKQTMSEVEAPWVETVKLLLDSGANIEATDEHRGPPLVDAAGYAQTNVTRLLLERGADLNARDEFGNTALIVASCECAVASMNDASDVVKLLLEKGSDVNAHSKDGTTALMNAAGGAGGSTIVKLLLDHGADPRARDSKGNTALRRAIDANRDDKVVLLKKALARPHKR